MRKVLAILFLALTSSCSMTNKIVHSSDRFDNIVLGQVDELRGPRVLHEEDHVILIVDTIIKGDIETVEGFKMKKFTHLSDSMVQVERVPVRNLKFRSTISKSNANFENGNSIIVSLVDSMNYTPEETLEMFMFGNKELVLTDKSKDPDKDSWHPLGMIYRINVDENQFDKIIKKISKKNIN